MTARWFAIPAAAQRALTASVAYAGARVTITDQLAPAVWSKVKAVLEKSGAVYAVGTSSFDFESDQDAQTIVSAALAAGRVMAVANAEGFVPTPADVAADLVHAHGELSPQRGRRLRVLEPSAGAGRFVAAIRAQLGAEWCEITAVEPDARRAAQIVTDDAMTLHVETFEAFAARSRGQFDVVVMNPPFAVPGHATLWAEHLMAAWNLLAPGGRLVAILPASVLDGQRSGRAGEAAALVRLHGGGDRLDRDAFAESGITVATAAVWLDQPLTDVPTATPLAVTRPYLTRGAALSMPVQLVRDAWHGADRVLRFCGDCITCAVPVWAFDDGENDPRGPLGDVTCHSLDPEEYGEVAGTPVNMCASCNNDGTAYRRGLELARQIWADAARERLAPVVELMPAPLTERTRQLSLFDDQSAEGTAA